MTNRRVTYPLRLNPAEYQALASQAAAAEQTKSGFIKGLIDSQRETDRHLRTMQGLAKDAVRVAREAVEQLKAERLWRENMERRLSELTAAGLLPYTATDIPEQIDTSTLTLEQMRSELTQ